MAQRKTDTAGAGEATADTPKGTTVEREQLGGTILLGGRVAGYTREGALSATEHGPLDPTVLPEEPAEEPAAQASAG